MSQESEFYKELDRSHRKEKDKTLSAWSLIVFFVIFIALVEGSIFYIGKNLRTKVGDDFTSGKAIEGLNLVGQPAQDDQAIYIPEGALCAQVAGALDGEVKCSITEENVQVSGKISPLLPSNASAIFVPNNANDRGRLELSEVKIGKVTTFKFLGSPLNTVLEKAIKSSIGGDISIKRIDLETAIMVLKIDK